MSSRAFARRIFDDTLAACAPDRLVAQRLAETVPLPEGRIALVAIGKAADGLARGACRALGARIEAGIIVGPAGFDGAATDLPECTRLSGAHPIPDETSLTAGAAVLDFLRRFDRDDARILFLLSGGGSAMLEAPREPSVWTLESLQVLNRALLESGGAIHDVNVVRRRVSAVKGGGLARAAMHAAQWTLYLSDVEPGDLASVASGPTWVEPDPMAGASDDFEQVWRRLDLGHRLPPRLADALHAAKTADGSGPTTSEHEALLDSAGLAAVAGRIARNAQPDTIVDVAPELSAVDAVDRLARRHVVRALDLIERNPGQCGVVISAGEATCPVRGDGRGGRNQEFALRAAVALAERGDAEADIVVASIGTDGVDGNSPAAGAIVDATTVERAAERGIRVADALARSDSHTLLARVGDVVTTGPTGNNLRDLRLVVFGPRA